MLFAFFKDPGKRFIKKNAEKLEAERQKFLLHRELKRKLSSEQKKAKAKALSSAAELHKKLKLALADSEEAEQLEELRLDSEIRIMKARMSEVDSIIKEFKRVEEIITQEEDLSPKEKIDLLKDVRSKVA